MLDDRPQRERREERQGADDQDGADQQADEQTARASGKCPLVDRHLLLGRQAAGGGQQRNEKQEAADQHRQADRQVVPGRVGADPANALPLLPVPLVYA